VSGNSTKPGAFQWGWLATALFILLLLVSLLFEGVDNQWLNLAGLILSIISPLFIFPPFYLLSKYGQVEPGESYSNTNRIVERSVFAIVRHPQYLGYMLLSLGFTLRSFHWITTLLGGTSIAFFYLQADSEERFCLERFGVEYAAYCRRVPRFNFLLGALRYLWRRKPFEGKDHN
jgi:protein-S-isoprenylcysteine O-methyltransferase Ste14